MLKRLFLAVFLCAGTAVTALPKVVCFRFDDNQSADIYGKLGDVFRKNNVRFSMSLIPLHSQAFNKKWREVICSLEKDGFEIMDHTPSHNTLSFPLEMSDPLRKLADKSFTDHTSERKVYLKYDYGVSRFSPVFEVKISGKNKISGNKLLKVRALVKIRDRFYYVYSARGKGEFLLRSIWSEDNVVLPDEENVPAQICYPAFSPVPGALEYMITVSREKFRQIGLKKMPKILIQPGGFYPLMGRNALAKVLKEQGYISASGIPAGYKGFGDPDIAITRYAMDWADFNLESMNLEREKTKIADTIACNRVAIGARHVRIAGKGKLPEYLLLHDKLLRWLAEKNIKVCTQSEASEILASTKIIRKENVLPDLACDLDGNGRPDGWFSSAGVNFNKGTVVFGSKGRALFVRSLCGLPGGKVRLMIDHEKLGNVSVRIRFCNSLKKTCGIRTKNLQSSLRKKDTFEFTIPANCAALDLEIIRKGSDSGKIYQLELRGI
jgi:hypothetical protein